MTLNKYFRQYQGQTNEADLYQKLVTESIQISGVDAYYVKRDSSNLDEIFGENRDAIFNDADCLEIYIQNFEGFSGSDNDIITKFGLDLNDELRFEVSKERFVEVVEINKPRSGDLLWLPLSDTLFEIKYAEDEEPFYSLGQIRSFKVTAEIFDYSGEEFTTGVDELDTISDNFITNDDFLNDEASEENTIFDTEDDGIVDFTEDNPFGTFGS